MTRPRSAWKAGSAGRATRGDLVASARRWRESGATHLAVNTMKAGLRSADEHIGALAAAADALGLRTG